MKKSNLHTRYIRYPFAYVALALLIVAMAILFNGSLGLGLDVPKSGLAVTFLGGLYLFFYFVFLFLQKKHRDMWAFIFLILMMLKLVVVFAFLFLFLNPGDVGNKRETLLFLMTYFVFLVMDITMKVKLMK